MAGQVRTLTVGSDLSVLDIFLTSGGNPVAATSVGFELFDSAGVSATSGTAVNPVTGKYTASGTVPAGFQVGDWKIQWNVITAGNELVTATELFCVQAVNIAVGFVPDTDKTAAIYESVRLDIGDPEGQVFDDGYLQRILSKAVRRLNHRLGLGPTARPQGIPGGFGGPRIKVSPIVADLTAGTITPNNDEICDLVIMQMEYIIVSSETSALKRLAATTTSGPHVAMVSHASNDGVSVKNADGVEVTIEGRRLGNRYLLHKLDLETKRKDLEAAIKAFLGRQTGNYGKMIY
jgi:hypothetical protein